MERARILALRKQADILEANGLLEREIRLMSAKLQSNVMELLKVQGLLVHLND